MLFKLLFALALCGLMMGCGALSLKEEFSSDFEKFQFNEEDRLLKTTILYPENPPSHCKGQYNFVNKDQEDYVPVSDAFLTNIFENAYKILPENDVEGGCPVVCLPYFLHSKFMNTPLDFQIGKRVSDVSSFVTNKCLKADVALKNYLDVDVLIYWIHTNTGERVYIHELAVGSEEYQQATYVGHEFVFVNKKTGKDITNFTVKGFGYFALGDFVTAPIPDNVDIDSVVSDLFANELDRANSVKRTFSELGFKKGKLPRDIWGSMDSFYHSNRDHATIEPWKLSSGLHVNWYEADCFMVWIPHAIRDVWAARLLKLVEEWVGIPLEPTSLYGMRKYTSGARLLTHVDRIETHAASLIVNVAQSISSPWPVQIYDFKHRLHEIEMEEGDIVYYESAKCLHGRMTPLPYPNGYYVNLFTHYRPIGDRKWYLKEKDAHVPEPWLEFEEGKEPSTLSPLRQTIKNKNDLFDYWKSIEVVFPPEHSFHRDRHSEL